MASQMFVLKRCDYPGCKETVEPGIDQEVTPIEFMINMVGRGRRAAPIVVDVCDEHLAELRGLHSMMRKFDQKDAG